MDEENYGGIFDGTIESILNKYGITKKMTAQVGKIIDGVAKNVEVEEVGDETHITINLNKIHFKFKKEEDD
jgi:hypothetical protein